MSLHAALGGPCAPQHVQPPRPPDRAARRSARTLQLGQHVDRFTSYGEYSRTGIARLDGLRRGMHAVVYIDAADRLCTRIAHFTRADAEGTYPVDVYLIDTDSPE